MGVCTLTGKDNDQAPVPRAGMLPIHPGADGRPGGPRSPVDGVLQVQVFQAAQDLCCVEQGPFLLEAGVPHVVDVELQVAPVHDGQDQAQCVLGLVGIGEVDLDAQDRIEVRSCRSLPPPTAALLSQGLCGCGMAGLGELQWLHATPKS